MAPATATIDRRSEERRPIRLKVAYRTAQSLVTEYTSSVSRGGCRLQARRPLDVGTAFIFEMYSRPGCAPVEVEGEVLWCNRQEDGSHEIGVRYSAPEGDRAALERVLDQLFAENAYDRARLHPRVTVRLPVLDAHQPERHYLMRDLSRGGMCLQMPVVHDLYPELTARVLLMLAVRLPGADPVELGAEVVWTTPASPVARAAVGAAFIGIGIEQQLTLDALMRLRRPSELLLTVGTPR